MATFILVHRSFLPAAEVHKVLLPSNDLELDAETEEAGHVTERSHHADVHGSAVNPLTSPEAH